MNDRQQFNQTTLANGVEVFTYERDLPITCFEIILPVGAGHAYGELLPGSPHFLEHAMLIRSKSFPEAYELDRILGLKGGHSNGLTYPSTTHYEIDVPSSETRFATEALFDRVFFPIFNEDDLTTERTVVINERNQRKFYPGKTLASQYYYSKFLNDVFYPLEQIFGSNEDLGAMSAELLSQMHARVSRAEGLKVLAVGNHDFSELKELLGTLELKPSKLEKQINRTGWVKKDYHKVFFETVSQPTLEVAWVHPRARYEEFRAISFLISLLINTTHGALYQEFREEKGWVYGLDGYVSQREHNTIFGLTFPLNTVDQVEYVRACLLDRIRDAILDQTLVEHEVTRYLCSQVYSFQTAGDIIGAASYDLMTYGKIYTEEEWREAVQAMKDPAWRESIFDKFFTAEAMGEACFMPERREKVFMREATNERSKVLS